MFYVYILINDENNSFYIGSTSKHPQERLNEHNEHFFKGAFTTKEKNWNFHFLLRCDTISQALKIEKHIKNMKSRKYIEDLIRYPEISEKLLNKYQP